MYGFVMHINKLRERCAIQFWVTEIQRMTIKIIVQYNKQLLKMQFASIVLHLHNTMQQIAFISITLSSFTSTAGCP